MYRKAKVLWVEGCFPINTRSERIIQSILKSGDVEVHISAWNRDGGATDDAPEHYHLFRSNAAYQNKLKKLTALPGYRKHVKNLLKSLQPEFVICSNWDMLCVVASIGKTVDKIYYDVADLPSGSLIEFHVERLFEQMAIRRTDAIMFASPFFKSWYKNYSKKKLVVENLPSLSVDRSLTRVASTEPLRVAYVGTVRYRESMLVLLDVAAEIGLSLSVYGDGPVLDELQSKYESYQNIKFYGRYKYEDIPGIYSKIDVVWAAYPPKNINVRYAISNKYYETLYFSVPGVFSDATKLGQHVSELRIGFTVDCDSHESVRELLEGFVSDPGKIISMREQIAAYSNDKSLTWDENDQKIGELFHLGQNFSQQ